MPRYIETKLETGGRRTWTLGYLHDGSTVHVGDPVGIGVEVDPEGIPALLVDIGDRVAIFQLDEEGARALGFRLLGMDHPDGVACDQEPREPGHGA